MKKIVILAGIVIIVIISAVLLYRQAEEKAKTRTYAAAFATKTWYYSSDAGIHWEDRAESGLQGFDADGNPIHVSTAWGMGKWVDENTISWEATKSLWKAFETQPY
jgi:hypothetical protein